MICINCGKELIKAQKKYCCPQCQAEYQNKEKIIAWQNGEFDGMKGQSQLSDVIRKYILDKAGYKCEICGWGEINPFSGTIPLEVHHKDGDYTNNAEDNLQVLCPNCHSLTENYRGANKIGRPDRLLYTTRKKSVCIDCGIEISSNAIRCTSCAGKSLQTEVPISREELKSMIRTMSFTQIGKKFGLSDNAIRKWCDKYGLPKKKTEIKEYSEEDWQVI